MVRHSSFDSLKRSKRIPEFYLDLFGSFHDDIEYCKEAFLKWLLENKIEELDCEDMICYYRYRLHVDHRPGIVIAIADTIARSQVHSVSFGNNELRANGPIVAEILTREGSNVRYVNLSANELEEYGPATAEKLTREGSQVQSVNLSFNFLGYESDQYKSATVEKLISSYKIIDCFGVDLTENQLEKLKSNAFDFFFKSNHPNVELNSLQALAAKSAYQDLLTSDEALPKVISKISISNNQNIEFLVKSLLFYNHVLNVDHIRTGKDNEIVKQYIEKQANEPAQRGITFPEHKENSIKDQEEAQAPNLLYLQKSEKRKRRTEVEQLKSCWATSKSEELPLKRKRK